jgi:hypothetical protein
VPAWKQSRQPLAQQQSTSLLRGKPILAFFGLLILVAAAVAIWRLRRPHYTYLLVFNPLAEKQHFHAGDGPEMPGLPADQSTGGWHGIRAIRGFDFRSELSTLKRDLDSTDAPQRRQTLMLYVQTVPIPDSSAGEYRCLVQNSDFDLEARPSSISLTELQTRIAEFCESQPETGVIVLLDLLRPSAAQRLGWVPGRLQEHVAGWTAGNDRLYVVTTSGRQEWTNSVGMGGGGKSPLAHFAMCGLSRAADQNRDGEVHALEFLNYVRAQTQNWIGRNRLQSSQAVSVFPELQGVSPDDPVRNFVVIADPAELSATVPAASDDSLERGLAQLYAIRESLQKQQGYLWNPVQWRIGAGRLQYAEQAYLDGRFDKCQAAIDKANESLALVQQAATEAQQTGVASERGLQRKWFADLPLRTRLQDLWVAGDAAESADDAAGSQLTAAEAVLQNGLTAFEELHSAQTFRIDESLRSNAVARRMAAEEAIAQLYGVADSVAATVLATEARLLQSEDALFVAQRDENQTDAIAAGKVFDLIGQYGRQWQAATVTFSEVLAMAPALADWAASSEELLGPDADDTLRSILARNNVQEPPTDSFVAELSAEIRALSHRGSEDWQQQAHQLRSEIALLFLRARALQAALDIREPAGVGFSEAELQALVDRITETRGDCQKSVESVRETMSSLGISLLLQGIPAEPEDQVTQYRHIRCLLKLQGITQESRVNAVRRVRDLDRRIAEQESEAGSEISVAEASPAALPIEFLWWAQVVNLLPASSSDPHPAQPLWSLLAASRDVNDLTDERAAEISASLRAIWAAERKSVGDARYADSSSLLSAIAAADSIVRLLPIMDLEQIDFAAWNPQRVLTTLRRMELAFLSARRLAVGRWVDAGRPAEASSSAWFAEQANSYLKVAESEEERLADSRLEAAASLRNRVRAERDRIAQGERMQVQVRAVQTDIDVGGLTTSEKVELRLQATEAAELSGTVSVSLLTDDGAALPVAVRIEGNATAVPMQDAANTTIEILRAGPPIREDCQTVSLLAEAFFRGRVTQSDESIRVNPCAGSEFVQVYLPRPATASITLEETDIRPVAFVLDFSNSMNEFTAQEAAKPKYLAALDVLDEVLMGTDNLPPAIDDLRGVRLRVFGHRLRYGRAEETGELQNIPNRDYEAVFERVVNVAGNANEDVELLFKAPSLKEGQSDELLDVLNKLRKSGPHGQTPLVKAVTDSLENDLINDAGLVIVITDGQPTDSIDPFIGREAELSPVERKQYGAFRNREAAFRDRLQRVGQSTRIVVVAYDVQEPAARASLERLFSGVGATIIDASDSISLYETITSSLDSREFQVFRQRQPDFKRTEGLSEVIGALPPADDYLLQFADIKSGQALKLAPGDNLDVAIDRKDSRFVFRRKGKPKRSVNAKLPSGSFPDPPSPSQLQVMEGAIFTAADSSSDGQDLANVEFALLLNHTDDYLPVTQPAEIEFEFAPQSGMNFSIPFVEQRFEQGHGAPCWSFSLRGWPRRQNVAVNALWKMERTPPDHFLKWEECLIPEGVVVGTEVPALSECRVWAKLLGNGTCQIRVEPHDRRDMQQLQDVQRLRVEIGERDLSRAKKGFVSDEVRVSVRRSERGSVLFEFAGRFSPDDLRGKEIALTSDASRRRNAVTITAPLVIPRLD